jgi:hypothetical protein
MTTIKIETFLADRPKASKVVIIRTSKMDSATTSRDVGNSICRWLHNNPTGTVVVKRKD